MLTKTFMKNANDQNFLNFVSGVDIKRLRQRVIR